MKKKLNCHCGSIEAEVEVPEKELRKFCVATVLFVKKKVT